jgi:hypothetical protein
MLKLGLHSTVELVLYAIRNQMVNVQLSALMPLIPQKEITLASAVGFGD